MSRRRSIYLTVLAVAVTVGLVVFVLLRARASAAPVSRASLASTFDSDIRHIAYAWDPSDPRSEADRRKALFDFMYETYQASAWIPQSLFDGNLVTQAVVGDVNTIVGEKAGLVLWRDNARVPAFGMAPNVDSNEPVRWTVNCLGCHMAEIDGVVYLGAGTKVFDEVWLRETLKQLRSERWRPRLRRPSVKATLAPD